MKAVFLGILVLFKCRVYALEHNFTGDIKNFVVGKDKVYVVTDSRLHQMRLNLVEEKYKDLANHTHPNKINILLPFEANRTLIICGTYDCGYCEVLDINDITTTTYREALPVVPANETSVTFLVDLGKNKVENPNGNKYLLVATESERRNGKEKCIFQRGVTLWNTLHSQDGAQLECCDDKPRRKLLSSAVISSDATVLWAGIFTALEEHEDTVLAIFDISDPGNQVPTDFWCEPTCTNKEKHKVLRPVSVVFKHSSMTSVAAEKKGSGIVLYIGTGNGQLIKLVLDKTFRPGCAMVLYRSNDDRMLFPRMHFDPEDDKYIYIALRNQIRRVSVTQCSMYKTLRDCGSSPDPLCGWCLITSKCSTQHECSDSTWISIPDKPFQKGLISFQVAKHSVSSLIQLTATLHLGVESPGRPPLFLCTFRSGSKDLCDGRPTAIFPNCSCSFSSQDLPSEGTPVIATVTIGEETLTQSLKLRNISETSTHAECTDCVSAGPDLGQTCTWNDGSAPQEHIQINVGEFSTVLTKGKSTNLFCIQGFP
ncbi:plexin-C1-like isoform X3 [Brachyhypopomus gauderio]|uniref:plexin-C1-like isoform X3 n=1 Tax=Brachyhypopomus gauderio TaxID=698409 RepID=UPI0040411BA0